MRAPRIAALIALVLATAGTAGAEIIDLGAKVTQEVHFLGDPLTFVSVPPGAFGDHPAGTEAELTLDAPSCNGPYCVGGQQLLVFFDFRYSGDLLKPVTFRMRYDEGAVAAFGVPETEIFLCRYEAAARAWLPMPGQTIDPDANWIAADEAANIRQSVAVFARNPAPVRDRTWGAIKALFGAGH